MFNSFPQPKPDSSGNNIKSMQSGRVTLGVGVTTLAVPIAAVDLSRAVVIVTMYNNTGASPDQNLVRAQLTSSNNVQLDRGGSGNSVTVNWQVVEFNNVKSLQRGNVGFTNSLGIAIISPVNYAKTMYFWSYYNTTTTQTALGNNIGIDTSNVTSNNQISFLPIDGSGSKVVYWQVIEFN